MIHVASLIHDDILDEADMRRGGQSIHAAYSNKIAVLAGDYLLAKASSLLARLGSCDVVEIMSTALDSLVQGELMQANCRPDELTDLTFYLRKTYFKTSSLIASSCRSAAILSGQSAVSPLVVACEEFGYHLGMAYQIVDDILDFTGASLDLGKPAQADMHLGLATAPLLFAAQEQRELIPIMQRRFKASGDIPKAFSLASCTKCIEMSYSLASFHIYRATLALNRLPPSTYRDGLLRLLDLVISRNK